MDIDSIVQIIWMYVAEKLNEEDELICQTKTLSWRTNEIR